MRTTVKMWGKSAAVRIPASVMQAAHLHLGDVVDVRYDGGRIVIESIPGKARALDDLLKRITPRNMHKTEDFGAPESNEAW